MVTTLCYQADAMDLTIDKNLSHYHCGGKLYHVYLTTNNYSAGLSKRFYLEECNKVDSTGGQKP